MKLLRIEFEYRDEMSRWEWRRQSCTCRSVEEAKRIYGLGEDVCEWRIVSVEEDGAETITRDAKPPKLVDCSGERHCLETAKALYELRLIVSGMSASEAEKHRALELLGALIEDVEADAELGGFPCMLDEAEEQIRSAAEERRAR